MNKRQITLNPNDIEKTPLYHTTVGFNGNRLEFFTEWQRRFVNTEIVVLDIVGPDQWYVAWINKVYDKTEHASPVELNW